MKKYCVYKHTHLASNRVYIGITCQTVNQRWRNGEGYKKSPYFYNTIKKYGWDSFSHEVLFDNLTKEQAEQLEIELIAEYDSTNELKGFNLASGGQGATSHKVSDEARKKMSEAKKGKPGFTIEIVCVETGQIFNSIKETSEFFNVTKNTIHNVLNNKRKIKGYTLMRYSDYKNGSDSDYREKQKPRASRILCIETNELFDTIRQASEKMGIKYTTLTSAVRRGNKCKGYTFVYCDK